MKKRNYTILGGSGTREQVYQKKTHLQLKKQGKKDSSHNLVLVLGHY